MKKIDVKSFLIGALSFLSILLFMGQSSYHTHPEYADSYHSHYEYADDNHDHYWDYAAKYHSHY